MREFKSAASVRIRTGGTLEISRMLRTAPWQAIPGVADRFQALALHLHHGRNTDIRASIGKRVGALGGRAEAQVKEPALRAMQHAPDQRNGVQETDGTNAERLGTRIIRIQTSSLTKEWCSADLCLCGDCVVATSSWANYAILQLGRSPSASLLTSP